MTRLRVITASATIPQVHGRLAQRLEHCVDIAGVRGSSPLPPTTAFNSRGLTDKQYVSLDIASQVTTYQSPQESWKYVAYAYNQLGNITSMNGTSYTYDANGNMTARGSHSLTWDIENRLVSYYDGSTTTSFVYDGEGIRGKKTVGSTTTIYVNKYYEKTGDTVTTSYYLGDRLVAQREGTTLRYIHQDHLSGTALTTASNGSSTGSIRYHPYGSTRSGSVPTDRKFTGQRLDSTGLYYYGARYYDPVIGRFISPDTVVQNAPAPQGRISNPLVVSYSAARLRPAVGDGETPVAVFDPQLLNRYTYGRNNPLAYSDASGNVVWWAVGAAVGAVAGFAVYAFTHDGDFNWGQAALYTGVGAAVGATFGAAAPAATAYLGAATTTAGATAAAATQRTGVWALNAFERGRAIEDMLGRTLSRTFPVIDKWINGIATSIKSIELTAKTYQNISNLTNTVKGYVNELVAFGGHPGWGGTTVEGNKIAGKVLELAVPKGATPEQMAELDELIAWAAQQGVKLIVKVIE